jgi:DNA-binding MarR family transcriptional regulator
LDEGINFLDIVVLENIKEESTIQEFSSLLNSPFFSVASYFGSLKIKNLVDIKSEIGRSTVSITGYGNEILKNVKERVEEPLDELDYVLLRTLATTSDYDELLKKLNIFPTDVSIHLYKLLNQGFITYTVNELKVKINLTEKGFKLIGTAFRLEKKETEKKEEKEEQIEQRVGEQSMEAEHSEGTIKPSKAKMFLEKTLFYLKKYMALLIILLFVVVIGALFFVLRV